MKHTKHLLFILLLVPFTGLLHAQEMAYFNDGEFDELRVRNTAKLFGYGADSLDEFVAIQKEEYLAHKSLLPDPGIQSVMAVHASSTCGSHYAVPGPLSSITCSHTSVCQEPDLFELTPAHTHYLDNWCGQGGEYNGSSWLYSTLDFIPYRHSIVTGSGLDPVGNFPVVAPGSTTSFKLGDNIAGFKSDKLITRFTISSADDQYFVYRYALVLQDPQDLVVHPVPSDKPSFKVSIYEVSGTDLHEVCCENYEVYAGQGIPGFESKPGTEFIYKDWTTNVINFKNVYGSSTGSKDYIIEFTVRDCTKGGHMAYAYIDGGCLTPDITRTGRSCAGMDQELTSNILKVHPEERISWDFGDGTTESYDINYEGGSTSGEINDATHPKHTYNTLVLPKTYDVELKVWKQPYPPDPDACPPLVLRKKVTIEDCSVVPVKCVDCVPSFSPQVGEKYVLSAWVSQRSTETGAADRVPAFTMPSIQLRLNGPEIMLGPYFGKGQVIDGWQKIEEVFDIPEGTNSIDIIMNNNNIEVLEKNVFPVYMVSTANAFFDDVRISPFKANLKSYVYDPFTQRLMAELDENNYATYYEYDEEGALIRVKKETERGISTIKESVNNTRKP